MVNDERGHRFVPRGFGFELLFEDSWIALVHIHIGCMSLTLQRNHFFKSFLFGRLLKLFLVIFVLVDLFLVIFVLGLFLLGLFLPGFFFHGPSVISVLWVADSHLDITLLLVIVSSIDDLCI